MKININDLFDFSDFGDINKLEKKVKELDSLLSKFSDNLQKDIEDYLFQDKYQYHHHWQEGDVVLSDQILTLHKRQTNDSDKLSKRVLNRITFRLSNTDGYVESNNTFKQG